ncbi:mu-type opioid receptor-like [Seriola lalandi dorsalis]|uniref:Mu-type opioid receptor-like n=1 Tax=Seriola lalandi dorsalis TaxID=1841481 RepID=A0A3B4WF64_SERLL|nr:mu-type opioid receptor-like [Seriola lalandi dorsalis]
MAANNSLAGDDFLLRKVQFVVLQSLVMIFLFINLLLIITFLKKEYFYTTARYILFALTLLSDSFLLFMSDILLIFTHFHITIQVWACIIIFVVVLVYITVTPATLAAMTLERYVAICMPLRHGELSSTRNTMNCILIIHGISSVPCILILSTFLASASLSYYSKYQFCSVEVFMLYIWQHNLRSALYQFQFLIMSIIIVFSYIKIMKVAKAASGDDKKSSKKGLRTVALHGFQLLLCLIQLWCPLIESAFFHINFSLYEIARYLNFLLFYLAPRCLSPLIYGLRDEVFFQALKYIASFGLYKQNLIDKMN